MWELGVGRCLGLTIEHLTAHLVSCYRSRYGGTQQSITNCKPHNKPINCAHHKTHNPNYARHNCTRHDLQHNYTRHYTLHKAQHTTHGTTHYTWRNTLHMAQHTTQGTTHTHGTTHRYILHGNLSPCLYVENGAGGARLKACVGMEGAAAAAAAVAAAARRHAGERNHASREVIALT